MTDPDIRSLLAQLTKEAYAKVGRSLGEPNAYITLNDGGKDDG